MSKDRIHQAIHREIDQAHQIIDNSGALDVLHSAKLLFPGSEVVIYKSEIIGDDSFTPPVVGVLRDKKIGINGCEVGVWANIVDYEKRTMDVSYSADRYMQLSENSGKYSAINMVLILPRLPYIKGGLATDSEEFRDSLKKAVEDIAPFLDDPDSQLPKLGEYLASQH